jgi:hypothetical protein
MFPFELDGAGVPGEDGSAFATPYKDRMAAFRTTKSTPQGVISMDENERRRKSDALKTLLMKSSEHVGTSPGGFQTDPENPFKARAPHQSLPFPQQPTQSSRSKSNPSTSGYIQDQQNYNRPPQYNQMPYPYSSRPAQTPKRPTSSSLRNVYGAHPEPEYAELSSDSAVTPPISTAKRHASQGPQYSPGYMGQGQGQGPAQMVAPRPKPSAQQLEDDLRRVLKLDLTSRG